VKPAFIELVIKKEVLGKWGDLEALKRACKYSSVCFFKF